MTDRIPVRVKRYGVDVDLPTRRTLKAGPLTTVLENADLRYVTLGGDPVVLRLYMAVRNRNWDTIEPRFTRFDVVDQGDGFRVELEAEHVAGEVDFAWSGVIEGAPEGVISYRMDGAPRKAFLKNRIGFCVLHPMELAGLPATVETPEGTRESEFPTRISPNQPFIDMISISHPAGVGGVATIRFEGDLFETEDQRNWTDASYKTYSTPLRLSYPVEVTPETRITQSVTISIDATARLSPEESEIYRLIREGLSREEIATKLGVSPSRLIVRFGRLFRGQLGKGTPIDVDVNVDKLTPLPSIGFGAGRQPLPDGEQLERLKALKPAHLWADLDLGADGWRERLGIVAGNAQAVSAPLDLSVIGGPNDSGWTELATAIRNDGIKLGRVFAFPPVKEPVAFPRTDLATQPETIVAASTAFLKADVPAQVGGGTRAYFTELNRATDFLPIESLDAVTYTINPQVHAVDNLSVIETLAAQAETVRSARAIVGNRSLAVGPVTFKAPYNPNATAAPPEPGPDQLPDPVDPRQLSLFGASWTVGSIHQLAAAGADALTYYELQGWRGVQERLDRLSRRELFPSVPGQLFPLYHVFAAVAEFAGGMMAEVKLGDGMLAEALALRHGDRLRLLIASFSEETRRLTVAARGFMQPIVRILDETSYGAAAVDPTFLTAGVQRPLTKEDGRLTLTLDPFAIACIDGVMEDGDDDRVGTVETVWQADR